MKKNASIVIAVFLVLGIAAFAISDVSQATACKGKYGVTAQTASACCAKNAAVAGTRSACSKSAAAQTAGAYSCSKGAKAASLADIRHREGKRVVLTGNAVCGKCNLGLTEACQTFFQTADGTAYRLMKNNHVKAMRNTETPNGFRIVSYVRKLDGTKYLEVKNFKTL
ncbi:MAG: hypothetical protein V3V49_12810 [Candidatus Krumholzibacteria bacterium]